MQVSNSTRQNARYRFTSGESVIERRLAPYSYAHHELEPGEPATIEVEVIDERGIAGSTLRVQPLDPSDEVILVEGEGGDCEVRVLTSDEPAGGDPEPSFVMDRMVETMLPPLRALLPSAVAVLQARRNAEARASLLREFGALTSAQVADLAGSRAANRAALAHRWKQEGRIFSVSHWEATVYPAFQLDGEGKPLPVIARVIGALGSQSSEWQLALWFVSSNGWLHGRRPVDLLETEPEAVAEAARRGAEELVF